MATKDDFSQNSTEKGVPGEPAGPMALPTGESSRSLADFNEKKKKHCLQITVQYYKTVL